MRFSKERMVKRVTDAGMGHMLDKKALAKMDDLDGCEASASCWERVVNGKPLLWVVGKSGEGSYVNEADCI